MQKSNLQKTNLTIKRYPQYNGVRDRNNFKEPLEYLLQEQEKLKNAQDKLERNWETLNQEQAIFWQEFLTQNRDR